MSINVFIASSLKLLSEERETIERIFNSGDSNNINVYRVEKENCRDCGNHDMQIDDQELIDKRIKESNVFVFVASDFIGEKTIHELDIAMKYSSNKRIYIYHLTYKSEKCNDNNYYIKWEAFANNHLKINLDGKYIEKYEQEVQSLNHLEEIISDVRKYIVNNPLLFIPCNSINYSDILPLRQKEIRKKGETNYYIIRPDVDLKLSNGFNDNNRVIIVSGEST